VHAVAPLATTLASAFTISPIYKRLAEPRLIRFE
jgi:hypothetical protein